MTGCVNAPIFATLAVICLRMYHIIHSLCCVDDRFTCDGQRHTCVILVSYLHQLWCTWDSLGCWVSFLCQKIVTDWHNDFLNITKKSVWQQNLLGQSASNREGLWVRDASYLCQSVSRCVNLWFSLSHTDATKWDGGWAYLVSLESATKTLGALGHFKRRKLLWTSISMSIS